MKLSEDEVNPLEDLMVRLDTVIFIIALVFTIYLVHQPFLSWLNYVKMEMYSYLTVTPIVSSMLVLFILKPGVLSYRLLKAVASIAVATLGLVTIFLAVHYVREYGEQLFFIGILLVVLTPVIYFSKENSLLKITLVTLASLTMVPIPMFYITSFSIKLTNTLLALSIPLTKLLGVEVAVEETRLYRVVAIPHGENLVKFNIAPICSGIVGLLSVLALTPLIIYIGFSSKTNSLLRKTTASVAGVVSLATLLFLANVFRLVSVFYFTSRYGEDVGYRIFHHTPEIILSIPITVFVIKLVEKINGGIFFNLSALKTTWSKNGLNLDTKTFIALMTPLMLLMAYAYPLQNLTFVSTNPSRYIYANVENGPILLLDLKTGEFVNYVPQFISSFNLKYNGRIRDFEEAAGATSRIHFYRGIMGLSKVVDVYIEFANLAGHIHLWEICLPVNEINITKINIVDVRHPVEPYTLGVREIHFKWGNYSGILFYWRDRVYTEEGLMYFRATVISISFRDGLKDQDREILFDLANELAVKNMDASFIKHAKVTVGENYMYFVFTPVALGLIVTHIIINIKGKGVVLGSLKNRVKRRTVT